MLLIGVAGGSGSGKTTVVNKIVENISLETVAVISQDAYYKDNGHLTPEEKRQINFDHPSSIEFPLMCKHLEMLKTGNAIEMPVYSYISCSRAQETTTINPCKVVIVEGILIYTYQKLRDLLDIKVYVDADDDDRLIRRVRRDTVSRGKTLEQILEEYEHFVKPMYHQFIEPTKRFADIIVPQGGQNQIAIDILQARINTHH